MECKTGIVSELVPEHYSCLVQVGFRIGVWRVSVGVLRGLVISSLSQHSPHPQCVVSSFISLARDQPLQVILMPFFCFMTFVPDFVCYLTVHFLL